MGEGGGVTGGTYPTLMPCPRGMVLSHKIFGKHEINPLKDSVAQHRSPIRTSGAGRQDIKQVRSYFGSFYGKENVISGVL